MAYNPPLILCRHSGASQNPEHTRGGLDAGSSPA
jgi:hypothetical protein